ncbi:hypothetical protein A5782_12695 [Mycobacterium sp. 852002-40037_SCH5390672]|nr:hypothetical protein A5782_12695 [Mycobacterium sp. 852002-40037_SCH5390672]
MPEARIVSALRTPIGTARTGTLRDTSAFDLAHHVVTEAARMHEVRGRGGGIGVAAMRAGGGMGSATVIEVAAP